MGSGSTDDDGFAATYILASGTMRCAALFARPFQDAFALLASFSLSVILSLVRFFASFSLSVIFSLVRVFASFSLSLLLV